MEDNSKATYRPGRLRLKLGDTSGYVAAPRPGQLSRPLHSTPTIPSVVAHNKRAETVGRRKRLKLADTSGYPANGRKLLPKGS